MNSDIIHNLQTIQQRIQNACTESNRDCSEVKLLLATKTVSAERIKAALNSGQTLIAENKVQELKAKYDALKGTPHISHFIGHLQTNKIKEILKYEVSCIQSLDRLDLAEKLQQRLEFENKEIEVFIQEEEVALTKLEHDLLLTFLKHKNQLLSREFLLEEVWEDAQHRQTKTVNVAIKRLKEKIDPHGEKDYIRSVRGEGYIFKALL